MKSTVYENADLTWLLHRAGRRMRGTMEEQSLKHGLDLRAYLVLKTLALNQAFTQLALGQWLGIDKTTLTNLLDRLEGEGLVVRRADPTDRRSRLPESTHKGRTLQKKVERAIADAEVGALASFSATDQRSLRMMLIELIETGDKDASRSCV